MADAELENGLVEPLLITVKENHDEDGEKECDDSEEASEDSHKAASSIASAYRLLTPSVKVRFSLRYYLIAGRRRINVSTQQMLSWNRNVYGIHLQCLRLLF